MRLPPEQLQSAQALQESEARFRALVRASSDVIYHMNADWSEMQQLDGRQFIADTQQPDKHWMEKYIHPHDRPRVREAIAEAIRTRGVFELEHRVLLVDGSLGWTHSRAVPMLNDAGEITEWVGMASDVTARRHAQAQLEDQRRLYEAILTNTPDLAYVWDLQHRFIYANDGLLRMWGKTWDEAIGKTCLELGYEPWHAEMHGREIDQVKSTRQPVRGQVPFNGSFGRRMYDYLLVPVIGTNGEVEAVAGTTRDVTESKLLESSLLDADRRKDEFVATLAHELRNPLAPIRNAVYLLRKPQLEPEVLRNARDIIDRQLQHMVRLVDDLLEVSRITLGQVTLRQETVDLHDVFRDALDAIAPLVAKKGHRLDVNIPAGKLLVRGDATRLSQVLQNLLDNAIKYTPDGGEISVNATRTRDQARITVRDNGIGIAPEMHTRIFELFTRVHPDERVKSSGLGIGLALARQLIKLHSGSIEVTSAGPDTGSEFVVSLPLLPQAEATAPALDPAINDAPAGHKRVLVVDDNRDAAESLAMIIEMSGCEVALAYDGPQALQIIATFKPQLAFMDIGMPGMDGYEVAQRVRAMPSGSDIALVALTGWGQAEDKKRAHAAGFDEHLTKPVDPDTLDSVLSLRRRPETV
jgi:PAS domain S-box-containing protein